MYKRQQIVYLNSYVYIRAHVAIFCIVAHMYESRTIQLTLYLC